MDFLGHRIIRKSCICSYTCKFIVNVLILHCYIYVALYETRRMKYFNINVLGESSRLFLKQRYMRYICIPVKTRLLTPRYLRDFKSILTAVGTV